MKNLFVGSVLSKSKQQANSNGAQQSDQVMNKNPSVKGVLQHTGRAVGRRVEIAGKDRPRGKSCDRMVQDRNESRNHYNEWSDDGGFGQWRAIHHYTSSPSRPDTSFHHARPISVSITDRIQLVLQDDKHQSKEQPTVRQDNGPEREVGRFLQPSFPAGSSYYPEFHPSLANRTAMANNGWAYQSGSSSEEAVGPKSLDSQWATHRQQQSYVVRVNHPSYPARAAVAQSTAASLSRKLSTYGTLPRNRQRFFMAKYQSKSPLHFYLFNNKLASSVLP